MMPRTTRSRFLNGVLRLVPVACVVIALLLCSCNRSGGANSGSASTGQAQGEGHNLRDLSRDEAKGGHTLKRHVGRTDAELQERLQQERNIGAASTFTDRATAERAAGEAIAANQDRVSRWLERAGRHPNLVLEYTSAQPVGRTLHRGDSQAQPCSHVLTVLKFDGHSEYHVLTAYPECR